MQNHTYLTDPDTDDCLHGMGSPDWCDLCRNSGKPSVYTTGGGMKYHASPSCSALREGQASVDNPEPIKTVVLGSAGVEDRSPCRTCKPTQ